MSSVRHSEKNYITPAGFEKLRAEYHDLKYRQRPEMTQTVAWAASNGDRSENGDYLYGKKKLREIDSRLRFLSKRIDSAEVIDPLNVTATYAAFGATVELRDEAGTLKTFAIVGTDESDISAGKISWRSPLAAALLKARASDGDFVTYESPRGEQEVEVLRVYYQAIS